MAAPDYLPFELRISGSFADGFRVQAFGPTGSSSQVEVAMPWGEADLEQRCVILSEEAAGKRRGETGASQVDVQGFGGNLFDTFFPKAVDREFRAALAQGGAERVRVRIQLDAPDLVDVPWEYLYDTHEERFLVLSNATPVVRTFNLPTPTRSPISPDVLNVLVMVAGAQDGLAAEQEFVQLADAVDADGDVTLTRVPGATLGALQDALAQGEYHVFHFIGHGRYDDREATGELWLEDDSGAPTSVSAADLTTHLADHASMRMVVLNACEGARTSVADPTSGLAQALFRGGIESVIAMQYEITDANALTFSQQLYRLLARREPLETAVTNARKSIPGSSREWATPVVFMRLADGRLFDDKERPDLELPEQEPAVEPPVAEVAPASSGSSGGNRGLLIGGVVAAVIVAVIAAVLLSGGGGDEPETVADSITETTTTTTTSTTTTTTVAPADTASDEDTHDDSSDGHALDFFIPADEPQDVPFDEAEPWWPLEVNDCIDPDLGREEYGYDGRYWVAWVSCADPDVLLTFDWFLFDERTDLVTFDVDGFAIWPGEDTVRAAAEEECQAALPDANTVDEMVVLTPIEEEWVDGEIWDAICLVPYNVSP